MFSYTTKRVCALLMAVMLMISLVPSTALAASVDNSKQNIENIIINVEKIWEGDNESLRPDSVNFHILQNGTMTEHTISLNAASNWKGSSESLPKGYFLEDGTIEEYVYTLQEDNIDDYYSYIEYDIDAKKYVSTSLHKDADLSSFTIKRDVVKIWSDNNNEYGKRTSEVEMQIYDIYSNYKIAVKLSEDDTKIDGVNPGDNKPYTAWQTVVELPKYTSHTQKALYRITELTIIDSYIPDIVHYDYYEAFVVYNCYKQEPTKAPSVDETEKPTKEPTEAPTEKPTKEPTKEPTVKPTEEPTKEPTVKPTVEPTKEPTVKPTEEPTKEPTVKPTVEPTKEPTVKPTVEPTKEPTVKPTEEPTKEPTVKPTMEPTKEPTVKPSATPTPGGTDIEDEEIPLVPSVTNEPSTTPSVKPSEEPTVKPSATPSGTDIEDEEIPLVPGATNEPSAKLSATPTIKPSGTPQTTIKQLLNNINDDDVPRTSSPKTADSSNSYYYLTVMLLAMGVLFSLGYNRDYFLRK